MQAQARLRDFIRAQGTLSAYVTDLDEMKVKTSVLVSRDLVGHRGDSQVYWAAEGRVVVQVGTRDVSPVSASRVRSA